MLEGFLRSVCPGRSFSVKTTRLPPVLIALFGLCLIQNVAFFPLFAKECGACRGSGTSSFACSFCKGTGKNNGLKCTFCEGKMFGKCGACAGSGQAAGGASPPPQSLPRACSSCNGSGTSSFACSFCKGTGQSGGLKCAFCEGKMFGKCTACNGSGKRLFAGAGGLRFA